jgi:SAM-dependent methyltransferase
MNGPAYRALVPTLVAALLSLVSVSATGPLLAQDSVTRRPPDVHFVPTDHAVVRAMLGAAKVRRGDLVYDLGCGDGRIVIAAVKRYGARGVCIDIDPARIAESRSNARKAGVAGRIRFQEADLFEMDLSKATVVTLYLLPALNQRLRPKLFRELRPGSRVVSNAFDMGDWRPDSTLRINPDSPYPAHAFYWVIPADVAGTWNLALKRPRHSSHRDGAEYEVRLKQRYQEVTATAAVEGQPLPVAEARLVGDQLSFIIADSASGHSTPQRFFGRVVGDSIIGTATGEGRPRVAWTAVRVERVPRPELESGAGVEPARRD